MWSEDLNASQTFDGVTVAAPDAVFVMDVKTLNDLLLEGLSPQAALADGRVQIKGDALCLDHFVAIFGIDHVRRALNP